MIWESLSHPWQSSLEEAWAAYCAGGAPIGAVITDAQGQIIAHSRHRIAESRIAHAEMNALAELPPWINAQPCVVYTTLEPCPMCTGAIRMCQIGQVHYAAHDPAGGSSALLQATPFMRRMPCTVIGPERTDLAALLIAMNTEFRLVMQKSPWVIEAWRTLYPEGVDLGYRLMESGQLRQLCKQQASVADVVSTLEQLIRTT